MAKTILDGYFLKSGGASQTLHSAAGRLRGFLISHSIAAVQTVIFYNDTAATGGTEFLIVKVSPQQCPYYVQFPQTATIAFDTGLHVANGSCEVAVWSMDHG